MLKNWLVKMPLISIFLNRHCSKKFEQDVYIMRHGESEYNLLEIFNSRLDSKEYPLSEKGRNQVHNAAQKMKQEFGLKASNIGAVFVSPMLRTRETAEILVKELNIDPKKVFVDAGIIELQMGNLDGTRFSDYPVKNILDHSFAHTYGGETDDDCLGRLKPFLKKIKVQHIKGAILIITHGTPAELLMRHFGYPKRPHMLDKAEFVMVKGKD